MRILSVALMIAVSLAAGCTDSEGGAGPTGSPPSPSAPTAAPVAAIRAIGPGGVLRVYHENMDFPTAEEVAAAADGTEIVLTFRLSPVATAAGEHDQQLRDAIARMEDAGGTWNVGYFHEPEIRLNPDEYRAAFSRVASIVQQSANVRSIAVLMGYTFTDRDPDVWYPGDDVVDVLGIDSYDWLGCVDNGGDARAGAHPRTFGDIFTPADAFATAHGKPWIATEFGRAFDPADPQARAAWLRDAAVWIDDHPSMIGGAYFQHSVADGYRCNWALDERELAVARDLWPAG
ncbi:MAG: hypothetical protein ABI572_00640 [Actinomycetota bacterium]